MNIPWVAVLDFAVVFAIIIGIAIFIRRERKLRRKREDELRRKNERRHTSSVIRGTFPVTRVPSEKLSEFFPSRPLRVSDDHIVYSDPNSGFLQGMVAADLLNDQDRNDSTTFTDSPAQPGGDFANGDTGTFNNPNDDSGGDFSSGDTGTFDTGNDTGGGDFGSGDSGSWGGDSGGGSDYGSGGSDFGGGDSGSF